MCQQSITLQTAVLMQVKELAQNGQQFSVHDITRNIRHNVANGNLEIPEVEVSGTSFKYNIPHAKIKALFDELWRTGVFDPDFTLSRHFNGTYFEYTPSVVNNATVVSPSTFPTVYATNANNIGQSWGTTSNPTTTANTVPTPSVTITPVSSGKLDRQTIIGRIDLYLKNCTRRNFRPNIKNIQSAIKRGDISTGWSSEDITEIVQTDLGYNTVPSENVSKTQVVTV